MVGNDIVDLGDGETCESALHPRFDLRVFNELERDALAGAADRHLVRWSLWAAKESAYKLARRNDPETVFSPRRFTVRLHPGGWGTVEHDGHAWVVALRSVGRALHVLCVSTARELLRVQHSVARIAAGESPHEAARTLACRELAASLQLPRSELSISSTPAHIPELRIRGAVAPGRLSLSHHGRYVAYAYHGATG